MERAVAPGVGAAAETSADCLFPAPALPGSGSMGIISAGVVHNASTPKHAAKVRPQMRGAHFFYYSPAGRAAVC